MPTTRNVQRPEGALYIEEEEEEKEEGFTDRVLKLTLAFDLTTQNHKGSSSHHPQRACLV